MNESNAKTDRRLTASWIVLWPLYLATVGLAYQVAYWSQFGINIIEYASIQNLVTLSVAPIALAAQPTLMLVLSIVVFETVLKPIFGGILSLLEKLVSRSITHRAGRLVILSILGWPIGMVFVMACVVALTRLSSRLEDAWTWLAAALIAAVSATVSCVRSPESPLPRVENFIYRNPLVWAALGALPFLSYALGLAAAERIMVPDSPSVTTPWLLQSLPRSLCLPGTHPDAPHQSARFVGHVSGYDFTFDPLNQELAVRVPAAAGNLRLVACIRPPSSPRAR